MQKLIVYGLALFLCVGGELFVPSYSMSGGIPKWVTKAPIDKENLYFVGIKTGAQTLEEGKRSAVGHAITELVEHLEIEAKTKFYEKRTELETKILDEINSSSKSIKVKGSLLNDWYFEKTVDGRYDVYVLIRYPKEEMLRERQRIQAEAAEKVLYARKALHQGMDAMARGEVNAAYAVFIEALKVSHEAADIGLYNETLNEIKNLIESIQIKAISGEAQKGELYKGLKEPLIVRVFLRQNVDIPVRNVPVIFELRGVEGDLTKHAITDDKGYGYCKVINVKKVLEIPIVHAMLDIDRLFAAPERLASSYRTTLDSYLELLRMKVTEFAFEVSTVKKNIKVLVLIKEGNNGILSDESIIGNELSEALAYGGYDVVGEHEIGKNNAERLLSAIDRNRIFSLKHEYYAMADIIVTGTVRTRKGGGNLGWTVSSQADGFVKAIDLRSGKVVAQKDITGATGFGDTEEKAVINSLRKLGSEISEGLLERLAK